MDPDFNEDELLKTKISVEKIKKTKGFEDLTDEEAEKLSDTLFQLTSIIFENYENIE